MKKTILTLTFAMVASLAGWAQESATVATYGNLTGNTSRTMTLALTHTDNYVAFSTKLELPEGVTVTDVSAKTPLKNEGTKDFTRKGGSATESMAFKVPFKQNGNVCRIQAYNLANAKIGGASGDILLTLTLTTTAPVAYNEKTTTARNITFVKSDYTEVVFPDRVATCRLWGDVNMDNAVDVKDYQAVGNVLVAKPVDVIDFFAADLVVDAEETKVDVKDYQKLSNIIVGK